MAVQTPPPLLPTPDPEIEAGVIEDARMRQHRHRRAGLVLISALILGALIAGVGGGGGASGHPGGGASGSSPGGGPGHAAANTSFPGAPATQRHGYGVETGACPLAPPSRYLPPRPGCVTVKRADINGDGRRDLVIVYSRLSKHRLPSYSGEPTILKKDYQAEGAFLRVVLAGGATVTARIAGVDGAKAAWVDSVAHVNDDPGDEIFLEVGRISSGATEVAYGLHNGSLVPAGVYLSSGGDSGLHAGFSCVSGSPPRLIQRYFMFVGPSELLPSWKESETIYAWPGPKLVRLSSRRFKHLVDLAWTGLASLRRVDNVIGMGCIHSLS